MNSNAWSTLTCRATNDSVRSLVGPSDEIVKWADANTVPSKQLNNKSEESTIKFIEEELFRHVNFIASSVQSVVAEKWKNSTALSGRDKTSFSTCIQKWFLNFNRKLVQRTGKTPMVNNIPYTLGCTRWSSAKSAQEFRFTQDQPTDCCTAKIRLTTTRFLFSMCMSSTDICVPELAIKPGANTTARFSAVMRVITEF